jgi:SAM-dependent methyltransferase
MKRKHPYKKRRPGGWEAAGTSWENVSGWYRGYLAGKDTVQAEVIFPGALRLLDPKDGEKILDVACGEGSFARMIARTRGVKIVGVDAAPSLVAMASRRAPSNAEFLVGDVLKIGSAFSPASFEAAACILAVQNMDPIVPLFTGIARALKPSGRLVLVMNHPAFRVPRQSGWGWDEERKLQYRRVDRYLSSFAAPIQAHPGSAPGVTTVSYHRPLQAYVAALAAAGFVVETLEEWVSHKTSDSGPRAKAENTARREIPMFLALRAKKR